MKNAIKRTISLLLTLAMLLGMISLHTPAQTTAPEPEEDFIFFYERSGPGGLSSSDPHRWNKSNGVRRTSATDPNDPDNKVGCFQTTAATSTLLRKDHMSPERQTLIAMNFMYPKSIDPPSLLGWSLFGGDLFSFSLREGGERADILFSGAAIGSFARDAWIRIVIFYEPTDKTATVSFGGDLQNAAAEKTTLLHPAAITLPLSNAFFNLPFTATGAQGFLMDDILFCHPGDLVCEPTWEGECNGTLTLTFSHDIDLAVTDLSQILLYDAAGVAYKPTSVCAEPTKGGVITLDYANDPLPAHGRYEASVGQLRDVTGRALYPDAKTISFRTAPEEEVIVPYIMPEGGFVMPDRHNTGYRCAFEELVPIGEKYPELGTTERVILTDAIAKKYDYTFSGFTHKGFIEVNTTKPTFLSDFYMEGTSFYAIQNKTCPHLTVSYGEGTGTKAAYFIGGNITISHCYVHDVCADHVKAAGGQRIEFNYFRDGGTRTPDAHADVIQFSGSTTSVVSGIYVIGNRFDIPPLMYDHVANCCFFFKPEINTLGYRNVQAVGNWFNGGGYTTYFSSGLIGKENCPYLFYNDNKIGYGHLFGPYTTTGWSSASELADTQGSFERNGYVETLEAGSIVFRNGTERVHRFDALEDGATVTINFANYMTMARSFRIEAAIKNAAGEVVARIDRDGEIRRYTPAKEYQTPDNVVREQIDGVEVSRLIRLPDLPSDVEIAFSIDALPEGATQMEIRIYDTTGERVMIRSGHLTTELAENTLTAEPEVNVDPPKPPFDHSAFRAAVNTATAAMQSGTMAERYTAIRAADTLLATYAPEDTATIDGALLQALEQAKQNYRALVERANADLFAAPNAAASSSTAQKPNENTAAQTAVCATIQKEEAA